MKYEGDFDDLDKEQPEEACRHEWGNTNLDEERGIDKTCLKCGKTIMKGKMIEVPKEDLEWIFAWCITMRQKDDMKFSALRERYLDDG